MMVTYVVVGPYYRELSLLRDLRVEKLYSSMKGDMIAIDYWSGKLN